MQRSREGIEHQGLRQSCIQEGIRQGEEVPKDRSMQRSRKGVEHQGRRQSCIQEEIRQREKKSHGSQHAAQPEEYEEGEAYNPSVRSGARKSECEEASGRGHAWP